MPSFEKTEMMTYLDQLIEAARNGSMNWVEVNPTTYSWDTSNPVPARLTLQLIVQQAQTRQANGQVVSRNVKRYFFHALEMQPLGPKLRVAVNGADDTDLNDQLERLYEAVQATVSQEGINFLKSILPRK